MFPCAHKICNICFVKCDLCPFCRTSKAGLSGEEQRREQEAREASERAGRFALFQHLGLSDSPESAVDVIHFQVPSGNDAEGPFSLAHLHVRSVNLSPAMMRALPDILERTFGSGGVPQGLQIAARRHVSSRGSRQQAAAVIEDIFGRRVFDL